MCLDHAKSYLEIVKVTIKAFLKLANYFNVFIGAAEEKISSDFPLEFHSQTIVQGFKYCVFR